MDSYQLSAFNLLLLMWLIRKVKLWILIYFSVWFMTFV